jgi:hypothetical protein
LTSEATLEAEIRTLWAEREPLYRRIADVVLGVDPETTDEANDFQGKVTMLLTLLQPFLCQKTVMAAKNLGPGLTDAAP